ncbi:hypothetical protein [Bradyrhizobium glycinis]|uniref:hypothetical protein n=1 Tax=Bradyrhizobium glycinis TaxID=2751812 RepID=UPI0018D60CD8|nr:hypothetical protein [Bradyrhizobium glycinis]MBH5372816.1 hypothetical protein [Bradyrhizobium glycinis]
MTSRLIGALCASLIASTGAFAAGTIPGISMTQQLDELARPLAGGKLYFIQAGTTAQPQNCYQDTALTQAWPNPLTLDAAGRVPQVFCADGTIKIRLTDKNGNQKLVQDSLLIVGPSGGGGGGGTVDPTTIFQTGAFMQFYGTGTLAGWVRCNGRTIGSASSGATERANADTQALFQYLWSADANLSVSGGRGASSNADWAANKTLTLPDCRGRVVASLDDMGNSAAGRLSASYFGLNPTTLGSAGGNESSTLLTANLPPYTPSVSLNTGTVTIWNTTDGVQGAGSTTVVKSIGASGPGSSTNLAINGWSVTTSPQGGTSSPVRTVQPTILATTFIKL